MEGRRFGILEKKGDVTNAQAAILKQGAREVPSDLIEEVPFLAGRLWDTCSRFVFDLAITQPTTFTGDASGHLVRGRAGINKSFGSVSFVASDYSRPSGYTTLIPPVTVLDPDEAERQEIERRLAAGLTRNRVFGTGVEAEIRRQNLHRLTMRVGALHLANDSGLSRTAPAGEIAYGYNGKVATLNARLRETPPSMQGVQIGGDERWVDGTVRIYRNLQFVSQGFASAYDVTGSQYSSLSNGGSLGTRFTHNSVRLELRGNHRESVYDTKSVRRTVGMYVGMPLGPFSLNGNAELGDNDTSRGRQPLSFYRADLRITRERGTASLGWSQISNGGLGLQQRIDALASIKLRDYELSGGAWTTRGYTVGGRPGVWTTAAVPTSLGFTVVPGIEYAPLTYMASPAWHGSLMLRRPLVVPLGFLKGFGRPAVAAAPRNSLAGINPRLTPLGATQRDSVRLAEFWCSPRNHDDGTSYHVELLPRRSPNRRCWRGPIGSLLASFSDGSNRSRCGGRGFRHA